MQRTSAQFAVALAVGALFTGLAPAAQAGGCSLEGVAGKYGYTSNGLIGTPPYAPFAAVGRVTFTKSGTISGAQVTSVGGTFFDETLDGPFTVNSDCTGSAIVTVYHGTAVARVTNLYIVWDNDEQEARGIFRTPGTAVTILARKMVDED